MIKPGYFSKSVAADGRRMDFDFHNEQLLEKNVCIDYLFIGDSITQLWEQKAYFAKDKVIINRGIGGDSSEYLLKRFEADAIQLKPKNIIMMIGTNDITAIEGDAWQKIEGASFDVVIENTVSNIKAIVSLCMKNNQKISIASIIPSDARPPFMKKTERNRLVIELNKEIQNICNTNELLYIDYHSSLCQEDGNTIIDELTPDGIHVNAKGYQVMADVLRLTLKNVGEII